MTPGTGHADEDEQYRPRKPRQVPGAILPTFLASRRPRPAQVPQDDEEERHGD